MPSRGVSCVPQSIVPSHDCAHSSRKQRCVLATRGATVASGSINPVRPIIVSGSTKIARIRGDQIEFELEKAERGMALPYDVGRLRNRLREARKRKVSAALKARRESAQATPRGAAAGRIVT